MSDAPTKLLSDRIAAIIERVKDLAAERDALRRDLDDLRSRLDRHEHEHARLRNALEEAIRELRGE
jgi:predicted  nucleic acid-binding Zn-ribbon protein